MRFAFGTSDLRRPYGTLRIGGAGSPTRKHPANERCAYGAEGRARGTMGSLLSHPCATELLEERPIIGRKDGAPG